MLHERDLKRQPLIVEDEKPKRISVIPDGFLDLRLHGQRQACVALELDRGTVEQAKWRQKVHGLIATAKGSYQQRFNTTSLTVAVIATPGDKRMWELLRWTEAELKQSSEDQADMFRFTSLLPTMVSPRQLFFSPVWRRPFFHGGISLLTS